MSPYTDVLAGDRHRRTLSTNRSGARFLIRRLRPDAADAGVHFGAEIEPGGLVTRGVDDDERVQLAELLNEKVANGGNRRVAGQHPHLRHHGADLAQLDDLFFEPL